LSPGQLNNFLVRMMRRHPQQFITDTSDRWISTGIELSTPLPECVFMIREHDRCVLITPAVAEEAMTGREATGEALEKSEARLALAQEAAGAGIWDWDIRAGTVSWSEKLYAMLGLDSGSFTPSFENWLERIHPDDRERIRLSAEQALNEGREIEEEFRIIRPDGHLRWLAGKGRTYKGEDGHPIRMIGIALDITERKRTEETLRSTEARLQTTLSTLLEGYQIIGFDWRYLYVNDAAARHGRRMVSDLIGRTMMDAYPGIEQQALLFSTLRRCMDERISATLTTEFSFADDSTGVFDLRIEPVPEGLFILSIDITDRRKLELALRESEAKYRAIVEEQTELICRFRPDTVLTFVNQAYCRFFEKSPEELLGQSALWILPESQREGVRLHIASLQANPRVAGREHEVSPSEGEGPWLEWTDQAIMDEQGSVIEIQSIGRDVTERKQAEMTLRQLSGRLLQLQDEERRRIARDLHDSTAQSLAALSMNLTVVESESDALSDEARKALGESLALAKHSTRELRTLSYLLHPPLLDESGLMSAVRWYVDGFSQRSGISVDLDLPLDPCRLPTEVETALFRIMQECLTNILRHSESPTAGIRVACDASSVTMEIRDQGKGMPASAQGEIGDPACRLGVGLMGMRERVRQFHGKLHIESGSRGTTVSVTLPLEGDERWAHFAS
jgi:PAS domain S-box-containing protein